MTPHTCWGLITPGTNAAGLEVNGDDRRVVARFRRDEPWFAAASAAFDAIDAGEAAADDWATIAPFLYGRWDEMAQAHRAAEETQWNAAAAEVFGSEGAFDPGATRVALAALDTPVLVLAGEFDLAAPPHVTARFAALFPRAEFVVQPGAGHYPWLDDAGGVVSTTVRFLN